MSRGELVLYAAVGGVTLLLLLWNERAADATLRRWMATHGFRLKSFTEGRGWEEKSRHYRFVAVDSDGRRWTGSATVRPWRTGIGPDGVTVTWDRSGKGRAPPGGG